MVNTTGRCYFAIKTDIIGFGLENFNKYLTISPTRFQEALSNGKTPKCTIWELSSEELINPLYCDEIENLISILNKHKTEFKKLKKENSDIEYVLQIVMYLGDETPALNINQEVLKFINEIDGVIDCDIYNNK